MFPARFGRPDAYPVSGADAAPVWALVTGAADRRGQRRTLIVAERRRPNGTRPYLRRTRRLRSNEKLAFCTGFTLGPARLNMFLSLRVLEANVPRPTRINLRALVTAISTYRWRF